MAEPKRITPEEVHQKLKAGKALLVCAYEDECEIQKDAASRGDFIQ